MEAVFDYFHPEDFSSAGLVIRQLAEEPELSTSVNDNHDDVINSLVTKFQLLSINDDDDNNSTYLSIQFCLHIHNSYWYRLAPHAGSYFQGLQTHVKSLHLPLASSIYLSYDMFYSFMQAHLDSWGELFDRNYRHDIIHDMIVKVCEIVHDDSNKRCQNLKVLVGVSLAIAHFVNERILFEEPLPWPFFHGMVPASNSSILQLPERMEIDEDQSINDDDCVICLEPLVRKEREKILCMPCSHIFHGDCITSWLENGHCCPVCRYEMPTSLEDRK